jgi:hypothetical protein
MIGLLWLASAATAAPDEEAAEEIIVYGDNFARWDDTRWMVSSQLLLPLGTVFASDENQSFLTHAFQLRAVVACDKDEQLSKKKWEVSCEIEDVGILVTTQNRWRREKDRAVVQSVLDEVDAKLTGMKIQMQVTESGGITNFGLEGLSADNEQEREALESLRQVITRMMAGFHLRIPDHAQRTGQWVEYHSELMDMPSLTSSRGSTTMVHQVSPYQGMQIVQTLGEGSVSTSLPTYAREVFSPSSLGSGSDLGRDEAAEAPTTDAAEPGGTSGQESEVELTYGMNATGVAIFRKADGIMTERVWLVTGRPTASSAGGTVTAPFENAGRILMLGKADKPDVGPSRQVSWPGRAMDGLESWVSLETVPTASSPPPKPGPG